MVATQVEFKGVQVLTDVVDLLYVSRVPTPDKVIDKAIEPDMSVAFFVADMLYVSEKGASWPRTSNALQAFFEELELSENVAPGDFGIFEARAATFLDAGGSLQGCQAVDFFIATMAEYHLMCKVLDKYLIAFTRSEVLGLFPPLTQNGDLVAVLNGIDAPVVLRRHADGYQLVGVCRVDAFENGAAGDMVCDGRAKIEKIKIY
ncbi:hypothetical protein IFR04_010439 [Cadophora malorum]|uniref:Uncharacterized protein n=1 Tax=Cadophora malorum TaxID=108018 RepID=A0A8H7TCQ8_9HELO|nr:hypothetical protein IFR04_010439 [Cadophora malorum]